MNKKIDLTELLKDCPKGMELDCLMYDNVTLKSVSNANDTDYPICIETKCGFDTRLTKYGQNVNIEDAKCVIFPKGKTSWEGFQRPFKNGDVVTYKLRDCLVAFIYKERIEPMLVKTHFTLYRQNMGFCIDTDLTLKEEDIVFANEEEKQRLFDAIESNGYRWNAKINTLEKLIEPRIFEKFYIRIGDIPSEEKSAVYNGDIVVGYEDGVSVYDCVEIDGLYRIIMPLPLKEGQGMTYECLIQEITQCRYKIENPRNIYLVSGIEVGKGHDNEPLIKEVKILKDLTGQFNTKSDNIEKNKTLEMLIVPKFKVGDRIKHRLTGDVYKVSMVLSNGCGGGVYDVSITHELGKSIDIKDQDNYELLPQQI